MIPSTLRAAACVVAVAVAVAACQPVDDLAGLEETAGENARKDINRRGAPVSGVPGTLAEVLARADDEAARWQDGARLAEMDVDVDGQGNLTRARLTYLAADADRLLTVTVSADGLHEERPTLGAFELTPITADALEALPPLPAQIREPAALAEAAPAAFAACEVDAVPANVLYASGAPLAWHPDAQEWTGALGWTATVTGDEGAGAVMDPVTAEPLDCVGAAD